MYKKILEPINISNYYIWNIKNQWWYLSKFWWSWFYNETEYYKIYWTIFNFLVFDKKEWETTKMWRFCVKINSLKDIKFLNEMFTYSNKKYFYSDQKEWIWKNMKTSWFSIWILDVEDLQKFDEYWIEVYQANSNLFQWMSCEELETIQTNYKKIIFLNEYLFSLYYFSVLKKLHSKKDIKPSSKAYKFINQEILFYEIFFRKEFKELLDSDDIIFMNSLCLEILDDSNIDIFNYSYFLKLWWYFKYFDDLKSLEDKEKNEVYKSIWILNSHFFKEDVEKKINLEKKIELFMKSLHSNYSEVYEKFIKKFNESENLTLKNFFYEDWSEETRIEYESNLFKPEYWFNWLTDFLFKK